MIILRKTLLEYDTANDEAKRANALETIKKYCSYNHNHPKPKDRSVLICWKDDLDLN